MLVVLNYEADISLLLSPVAMLCQVSQYCPRSRLCNQCV